MPDSALELFTTFGELLRYLRQRAQLTQDEFGLTVGYSRAHVTRLENGQRQPDVVAVRARFADALHLHDEPALASRLIELASAARDNAPTGEAADEPARRIPNNLPTQVTSFIGRECELSELRRLLASTRLLTLTGSGGTGKTRLALELAAEVMEEYPDGVWLIELAPVADPAFVPRAVAAVVGVHEGPSQPLMASLQDALRGKHILLILDNCEHLIDACAQFAEAVLRSGAGPRILATSREGLNVPGELTWRVASLQTPAEGDTLEPADLAQYEAVRLFVERATYALPGFALTEANAPAVRQIVARLDGIPLAIELAAARVKVLAPEKVAERLSDRFRLLTGGSRTALPRQQTLRGAIDWSFRLLSEPERVLLRRLSVFAGGWTLEACEAVCAADGIEPGDVLDLLTRLVDKSLVVAQTGEDWEITRYRLLETIRQYAQERLADTDEDECVRRRHYDYFLRLGRETEPALANMSSTAPGDQPLLLKRLRLELDNVRRAWDWVAEAEGIDGIWEFYSAWHDVFLWHGNIQPELLSRLLNALDLAGLRGNTATVAKLHLEVASIYLFDGELERAVVAIACADTIIRTLHDPILQASLEGYTGRLATFNGHYAEARSHFQKRYELLGQSTSVIPVDHVAMGYRSSFGNLALAEGEYHEAERLFRECLALSHPDNRGWVSSVARRLGYALLGQGKITEAEQWIRSSLVDNRAMGDVIPVAGCLAAYAMVSLAQGNLPRAACLFGASEAITASQHLPLAYDDTFVIRPQIAALRERLDAAVLEEVWKQGRAMTYEQAVDFALVGT